MGQVAAPAKPAAKPWQAGQKHGKGTKRPGAGARAAAAERIKQLESGIASLGGPEGPVRKLFKELPLSSNTLLGLETSKFRALTTIQRAALPHALAGRDILGAAKTGSGKTLCFLIPVSHSLASEGSHVESLTLIGIFGMCGEQSMQITHGAHADAHCQLCSTKQPVRYVPVAD